MNVETKSQILFIQVEQYSTLVRCMTSKIGKIKVLFEQLDVQVFFSQMKLTEVDVAEGSETIIAEIQKKLSLSPMTEMKTLLADKLKLLETCNL